MLPLFKDPQDGDELSAEIYVAIYAELERLGNITGDGQILVINDESGIHLLSAGTVTPLWIKVTAVGADGYHYAWTEQIPATGGTWINGTRSGTTSSAPAQEFNGYASVTLNKVYPAWILSTGEVRFQSDTC